MSDLHEDNLNRDYKDKPKRKTKNSSRVALFAVLGAVLMIGGATLAFLVSRPTTSTATVKEFPVQPYPTFPVLQSTTQDMVATDSGFAVLTTDYQSLSLETFLVNLNTKEVLRQASVPIAYGAGSGYSGSVASAAISPNLDLLWSNYGNVTMFMSAEGVRQTVALNALTNVAFSGDGSRFALLTSLGEIVVYDTATRAILTEISDPQYGSNVFFTMNQDGTKLLTSSFYTTGKVYDVNSGQIQVVNSTMPAVSVPPVFLASGELVGINYNAVVVMNEDTPKTLPLSQQGCENATQIQVSSDDKTLAIMGQFGLCVVDMASVLAAADDGVTVNVQTVDLKVLASAIAFSKDNQTIGVFAANSGYESHLYVVDLASMSIVAATEGALP
jgi:hypothetical protein